MILSYAQLLEATGASIAANYPASIIKKDTVVQQITVLSMIAATYHVKHQTRSSANRIRQREAGKAEVPKVVEELRHANILLDCLTGLYQKDPHAFGSAGAVSFLTSEASGDEVFRHYAINELNAASEQTFAMFDHRRDALINDRSNGLGTRMKRVRSLTNHIEDTYRSLIDSDHFLSNSCSVAASLITYRAAGSDGTTMIELCRLSQKVFTAEATLLSTRSIAA